MPGFSETTFGYGPNHVVDDNAALWAIRSDDPETRDAAGIRTHDSIAHHFFVRDCSRAHRFNEMGCVLTGRESVRRPKLDGWFPRRAPRPTGTLKSHLAMAEERRRQRFDAQRSMGCIKTGRSDAWERKGAAATLKAEALKHSLPKQRAAANSYPALTWSMHGYLGAADASADADADGGGEQAQPSAPAKTGEGAPRDWVLQPLRKPPPHAVLYKDRHNDERERERAARHGVWGAYRRGADSERSHSSARGSARGAARSARPMTAVAAHVRLRSHSPASESGAATGRRPQSAAAPRVAGAAAGMAQRSRRRSRAKKNADPALETLRLHRSKQRLRARLQEVEKMLATTDSFSPRHTRQHIEPAS